MHLQNSETGLLMNKVSLLYWAMHLKPYMTWHFKTNHGIFIWSLYHNIEHTTNQNTGKLFYARHIMYLLHSTFPLYAVLIVLATVSFMPLYKTVMQHFLAVYHRICISLVYGTHSNSVNTKSIKATRRIYRGYYTVAQRYKFYFRVAKQYFTNERSE